MKKKQNSNRIMSIILFVLAIAIIIQGFIVAVIYPEEPIPDEYYDEWKPFLPPPGAIGMWWSYAWFVMSSFFGIVFLVFNFIIIDIKHSRKG